VKGAAVIVWALLIFTVLVLFMFTTVFVYKYRMTITINYEYNFNNVQLALLTLLSSENNEKKVLKSISEHNSLNSELDIGDLESKLDTLIGSKCYTFNASTFFIEGNNTECNKKYKASTKIPYPFNPENITGEINLAVGE
jgi:hypothetical protein